MVFRWKRSFLRWKKPKNSYHICLDNVNPIQTLGPFNPWIT